MGMKKKTSTKYETLGCVFDEILFFHFKDIGRNELKQASIKVRSCFMSMMRCNAGPLRLSFKDQQKI